MRSTWRSGTLRATPAIGFVMRLACSSLALSVCLALGGNAGAAEPAATAEKIKLPLPWQQGQALEYATERVKTATAPGKREKTLSTSTSVVRTIEANAQGFVQEWRWRDASENVVEGDKTVSEALARAIKDIEAEDVALVVELAPDGSYRRARNVEQIGALFRKAMRPAMLELMTAGVDKAMAGQDAAKRKDALDKVPAETDGFLQRFTQPALLETMLTREIQTVLNFSGAELDNDQMYELETLLENPTGGAAFPAKLSYGLYVGSNEPEDIYLEWTLEIDPVKGADAVWDTLERMFGRKIGAAERKELPAQISIVDKGFIVFERATGLPEMFENVRTTKLGEHANYERHRMRLLDHGHEHEWAEQLPQDTDPALSADERDAQLCADEAADVMAAIAACSRTLEHQELEPKPRARWLASRAAHRSRAGQQAEAITDFGKAIALQPANAAYFIGRAGAHGRGGDHRAALADAEQAATLEPTSAQAQLLIGSAHEGLQDYARAETHFSRAIELAPGDARGHDARCWTRAMREAFAAALADCDRALALDAAASNSYNSRGYVHYRSGRHADAIRDYDAAIAARPDVASSWYVRGLARRALGDARAAEADIAKGLALDPKVAERYAGYGVK